MTGHWEHPLTRFGRFTRMSYLGCWEWVGSRWPLGYGRLWDGERRVIAHRWSYEQFVGPIPVGLTLDHLCRNRACVNPFHLEPVTQRENVMRGTSHVVAQSKQTHCKHGHEFTPENTFRKDNGGRGCITCRTERAKARLVRT